MQLFPTGKTYNFMAQRKVWATVSVLFVLASIVMMFYPGPHLGTDFKGGTEVELTFQKDLTDDQIRQAVESAGFSSPDVIHVHDDDEQKQRSEKVGDGASALFFKSLLLGNVQKVPELQDRCSTGGLLDLRFDPSEGDPAWKLIEKLSEGR